MPFYQVDNAGGAWTHALHIHADEINDDGNGPTSRTPRAASAQAATALPRYRVTAGPPDPRPTLASATALAAGDSQRPPTPARARQEAKSTTGARHISAARR